MFPLSTISTDLHLASNDSVTECGRVYAGSIYANGLPVMLVCTRAAFAASLAERAPCAVCKQKYQASQIRVRRARMAYERRLDLGYEAEVALRSTRQEFDLTEAEEDDLLGLLARRAQA